MNNNRRNFVLYTAASGCGLVATTPAWTQQVPASELVEEKDALAVAVGYTPDASKIDSKKFTTYAAGQRCGVCTLFQGQSADASGACPLFPGKRVAAIGWCTAWAKRG